MNYELAMMALEGLTRSQLDMEERPGELVVAGEASSLRELARLLLLLGSEGVEPGEEIELRPGAHLSPGSPRLRLRRIEGAPVGN